tara:strand:+ start:13479 stop:14477 length:999 start_codon:yes stop_codon:yes gene_type:complete
MSSSIGSYNRVTYFKNVNCYKFIIFIIAVVYGIVLAELPFEEFRDRQNYLAYASSSPELVLRYLKEGLFSLFSNEPLWLGLNVVLNYFFSPEQVVKIFIAVPATIVAYVVLSHKPKYFFFLLLFVLYPHVIKNHIIHLRQGVAISIFLLGFFKFEGKGKLFLIGLTPFVHASFFFVIFFMVFNFLLSKLKLAIDLKVIAVTLLGVLLSFSLGAIASLLEARQASEYKFSMAEVSGVGFLFWFFVIFLFSLEGRSFSRQFSLAFCFIAFYLSSYFFIEVTGRIFESAMLIVLLSGLYLTSWRKRVFLASTLFFSMLTYLGNADQHWLGWGVGG